MVPPVKSIVGNIKPIISMITKELSMEGSVVHYFFRNTANIDLIMRWCHDMALYNIHMFRLAEIPQLNRQKHRTHGLFERLQFPLKNK